MPPRKILKNRLNLAEGILESIYVKLYNVYSYVELMRNDGMIIISYLLGFAGGPAPFCEHWRPMAPYFYGL